MEKGREGAVSVRHTAGMNTRGRSEVLIQENENRNDKAVQGTLAMAYWPPM